MVFIFGMRRFGLTDVVPGVFYIRTTFFHFDFVPLFPTESFLVLNTQHEQKFIKIPLNKKSICVAYLRSLSLIGTLLHFVIGIYQSHSQGNAFNAMGSFVLSALFCVIAVYSWCSKGLKNASYERAKELCSSFGPRDGPKYEKEVDKIFMKTMAVVDNHVELNGSVV